jgi:hypothetical protein
MFLDFVLLLVYSLLPGFAKIFDKQAFFLMNLPIIIYLLFRHRNYIVIRKIDIIFIALLVFVFFQSISSFFSPHINREGLYMGVFMYLIPFVGFFYSKAVDFETFVEIILKIVLIHCFLGIILYPAFGLGDFLGSFYLTLNEGVAFGRMSSVSGSLGFANLMFVGFVLAYHSKKSKIYLLIIGVCLLMSLQRSSWLAAIFAVLISTMVNFRRLGVKKITVFILFIILTVFGLTRLASNDDFDILFSRFSEFGKEAASERSEQWVDGIDNFMSYPLGAGVGQVGQISARHENNPLLHLVPDGDFLRVMSEIGIVGLLFYLLVFMFLFYTFTTLKSCHSHKTIIVSLIFGYSIQMIGSNITEFYFTNFIYWIFMGYFFNLIRIEKTEWLYSNQLESRVDEN